MDQKSLAKVALEDGSAKVRAAALRNLQDQKSLAKVALEDGSAKVRAAALRNLQDQKSLAKVALEDGSAKVRAAALRNLQDQQLLAEFGLKDRDTDVRAAALRNLQDQRLLAEVVLEDNDSEVRVAALKNLHDQRLLAEVGLKDSDSEVRVAALKNLHDQKILSEVALEDKSKEVRVAALRNLRDQKILSEVALEDKSKEVRAAAFWNLEDQKLLIEVGLEDRDPKVRFAALRNLEDQRVLYGVALEDRDKKVQIAASKKLKSSELLRAIISKVRDKEIRTVATENLIKNEVLAKLLIEEKNIPEQSLKLSRALSDPSIQKLIERFASFREEELKESNVFEIDSLLSDEQFSILQYKLSRIDSSIKEFEQKRVVNISVVQMDQGNWMKAIKQGFGLVRKSVYLLKINIGQHLKQSIISDPKVFPVEDLPVAQEGHWLDVYLFCKENNVLLNRQESKRLFLPIVGNSWSCNCNPNKLHKCTKAEREEFWMVPFSTPDKKGKIELKIAIYFQTNLLQVLIIKGDVVDKLGDIGEIEVEYDYKLTSNYENISKLEPKSLSIHTTDTAEGYELLIKSERSKIINNTFNQGQVVNAVDPVRHTFKDIYYTEYEGGDGQKNKESHFDNQNRKDKKSFAKDLKQLAWLGHKLWTAIDIDEQKKFWNLDAPYVIQVARSDSSTSVFPWAMIYDIPLVITSKDPLNSDEFNYCRLIEEWDDQSHSLKETESKCPYEHEHKKNTLCPFGFWGIKYIIEQPISGSHEKDNIIKSKKLPPDIAIGYTNKTIRKLREAHFSNLLPFSRCETLNDLEKKINEALEVLYFYAHGVKEPVVVGSEKNFVPALEIGDDVIIRPETIKGWPRLNVTEKWKDHPPLVFINGCHTADFTPDLLSNLMDSFSEVGAAGVIGTEIPIHQRLANEAAEVLFRELFNEVAVGEAIRRMRIHLLKKGNLLGLAYTPYCMGNLQFKKSI